MAKALTAAAAQIQRGGWTRPKPRFLNVPFLDVVLTAHEIAVIDEQGLGDRGGFPGLMLRCQERVNRITGQLRLTNDDLRRIALYAYGYGDKGRWQTRLLEVFQRTLGLKLDRNMLGEKERPDDRRTDDRRTG